MIADPWASPQATTEDPHGVRDLAVPRGRCDEHGRDLYTDDGRCGGCDVEPTESPTPAELARALERATPEDKTLREDDYPYAPPPWRMSIPHRPDLGPGLYVGVDEGSGPSTTGAVYFEQREDGKIRVGEHILRPPARPRRWPRTAAIIAGAALIGMATAYAVVSWL